MGRSIPKAFHHEPVPSPLSIPGDEGLPIRVPTPWPSSGGLPSGERLYLNEGLVFAIFGMEMRGAVVAEVHSNHNPKESRHLGHSLFDLTPFTLRPKRQGLAAARVFGGQGAGIGVSRE